MTHHDSDTLWEIVQDCWDYEKNEFFESIMSLGNGHMGLRGNHEEIYSGPTLQGMYFAGIYYPDRTKVGWWKVGYPETFSKIPNAPHPLHLDILVDGACLDLASEYWSVDQYSRRLDMKHGALERRFKTTGSKGQMLEIHSMRLLSYDTAEAGLLRYQIKNVGKPTRLSITVYTEGNVFNQDAHDTERFWLPVTTKSDLPDQTCLVMKTKKTEFMVAIAANDKFELNGKALLPDSQRLEETSAGSCLSIVLESGELLTLERLFTAITSRDHTPEGIESRSDSECGEAFAAMALKQLDRLVAEGSETLKLRHENAMAMRWKDVDVEIEGDPEMQRALRFNLFQLMQAYNGKDSRLNLGPKGLTGEKYGGGTYWDTEAYALPFYLGTSPARVSEQLLRFRHQHLEAAKVNASKLGLCGALYPMVTMTGEECHNEWEITFEEIHRNAAIAYAIELFTRYHGDQTYLEETGIEVLVETARFWASRVDWNQLKSVYMILGVTGPNEYENNVNNNWYTNKMAAFNLEYAGSCCLRLKNTTPERWNFLCTSLQISEDECNGWKHISENLKFPFDEDSQLFMQQDGYLDKPQRLVSSLSASDRPLYKHWSWDRILRSCFIKQADVLQYFLMFEEAYDSETTQRHFEFYEPRTVHESSLSASAHAVIAARIGKPQKAYELFRRAAMLDLEDINADTSEGLHVTAMAGCWMAAVYGFGGVKPRQNGLFLDPALPAKWKRLAFSLHYRNRVLRVTTDSGGTEVERIFGDPIAITLNGVACIL